MDRAVALDGQQMAPCGVEGNAGALGRAGISEMDANTGAQLVDIDRFAEIIDTAGFQRMHDMFGLGQAGHEDDRHLRHSDIRLQPAAGLEAIHGRHDGVEQDEIGRDALDDAECCRARCGDQHGKAGLLERIGQETERFGRVIDKQNDVAGKDRLSQWIPPFCRSRAGRS